MIKLNFKIFAAHVAGCAFSIWSFRFMQDDWYIPVAITSTFIIFALYIIVGFQVNDGERKGPLPIISIFWLSLFLFIVSLPMLLYGIDAKTTNLTSWVPLSVNASFARLLFIDTPVAYLLLRLPTITTLAILSLLPSTLAAFGFILKNLYFKHNSRS